MAMAGDKMKNQTIIAVLYAFAAALFYALSVPCSKMLLNNAAPAMMAAFLYLGAGIMYLPHLKKEKHDARLSKKDRPYTVE